MSDRGRHSQLEPKLDATGYPADGGRGITECRNP
jgi:hypothetical protein